jgi:hypothetical protein
VLCGQIFEFEGTRVAFQHYGLDASGRDFVPIIKDATAPELEALFAVDTVSLLFYGHIHRQSDVYGAARYLTPGSLGCFGQPVARYHLVDFGRGGYTVEHRNIPYDDGALYHAFMDRHVPEREFIFKVFFGGRFQAL